MTAKICLSLWIWQFFYLAKVNFSTLSGSNSRRLEVEGRCYAAFAACKTRVFVHSQPNT